VSRSRVSEPMTPVKKIPRSGLGRKSGLGRGLVTCVTRRIVQFGGIRLRFCALLFLLLHFSNMLEEDAQVTTEPFVDNAERPLDLPVCFCGFSQTECGHRGIHNSPRTDQHTANPQSFCNFDASWMPQVQERSAFPNQASKAARDRSHWMRWRSFLSRTVLRSSSSSGSSRSKVTLAG